MQISGWNRRQSTDADVLRPRRPADLPALLRNRHPLVARGLGRSYGDSALAACVLDMRSLDHLLAFEQDSGLLHCEAGVSLRRIIDVLLPQGWFPAVVPGTAQVTVGGAIASDVHGKNHHHAGSFCDHVEGFTLCLADGTSRYCSRDENAALFYASCGGMGLTGIIVDVRLRLRRVPGPMISQRSLAAETLEDCIRLLDQQRDSDYAVAWLDFSHPRGVRGIVLLGEHATAALPEITPRNRPDIVFQPPTNLIREPLVMLHNRHYWRRHRSTDTSRLQGNAQYFFPLDAIGNWNRLYGPAGFQQYQFVLPLAAGSEALAAIVDRVRDSGLTVSLAVLKILGPGNGGLLSFPLAGYTLALDFPEQKGLHSLLDELDGMVCAAGGRIYLSKDARMSADVFRHCYPRWQELCALRTETGADRMFRSQQSERLGL